jgi:hypothetical protein
MRMEDDSLDALMQDFSETTGYVGPVAPWQEAAPEDDEDDAPISLAGNSEGALKSWDGRRKGDKTTAKPWRPSARNDIPPLMGAWEYVKATPEEQKKFEEEHRGSSAGHVEGYMRPTDAFASQASQYPKSGPPGVSYFKGDLGEDGHVDCLLYRDDDGKLLGILNRYPKDMYAAAGGAYGGMRTLVERKGNFNVIVSPEARRQGVGMKLLKEADKRWKLPFRQQQYTAEGRKLITRYLDEQEKKNLSADWDEGDHPRADDGKFATKAGEGALDAPDDGPKHPTVWGQPVDLSAHLVRADGFTYKPSRLLLDSIISETDEAIESRAKDVYYAKPTKGDETPESIEKGIGDEGEVLLAKYNAKMQKLVDEATPIIKIGSYILGDVMAAGEDRFKNQHETGTSGGWLDPELRTSAENHMFGEYADNAHRPIYGSLTNDPEHIVARDIFGQYGDVAVVLDPSVKQSATVSFWDSLDAYEAGACVPRPATHMDVLAIPASKLKYVADATRATGLLDEAQTIDDYSANSAGYVEMQVHGGVPFSKIKAIYAPTADKDDAPTRQQLAKIARWCHQHHVPLRLVPPAVD